MSSQSACRSFFELPVELSILFIELLPVKDLISFCLVSKTALDIAQPLLYKDVELRIDFDSALIVDFTGREQLQLFLLRRTLRENLSLRGNIKKLELTFKDLASHWDIDSPTVLGETELFEFASWFKSVRNFTMIFNFFQSATEFDLGWRLFIQAVRSMPKLEELSFSGGSRLDHPTLLQLLHPLRLKVLQMNCMGLRWKPPMMRNEDSQVFDRELGSLKDLEIEAGEEYTDLQGLLPWCTKLQTLTLGDLALGVNLCPESFALQELLAPIKLTLRELTLRFPSRIGNKKMKSHQMRISELTSLHSLFLMDWMIEEEDQASEVYEALFSGQLKKFMWFYNEWSPNHQQLTVGNILTVKDAFLYSKEHSIFLEKFVFEVKLQPGGTRFEQIKMATLTLENELKNLIAEVECVSEYLR
jgi:hypothetical protein